MYPFCCRLVISCAFALICARKIVLQVSQAALSPTWLCSAGPWTAPYLLVAVPAAPPQQYRCAPRGKGCSRAANRSLNTTSGRGRGRGSVWCGCGSLPARGAGNGRHCTCGMDMDCMPRCISGNFKGDCDILAPRYPGSSRLLQECPEWAPCWRVR